jgi:mannose-6-phosphate isomerase-like protein (cupin superfamily)
MFHILHRRDQRKGAIATVEFEGEPYCAGAGDIVVIGPATPHRFAAIGDERLDMVCAHASDRFIIECLSD